MKMGEEMGKDVAWRSKNFLGLPFPFPLPSFSASTQQA